VITDFGAVGFTGATVDGGPLAAASPQEKYRPERGLSV
jgi:hypothetical protein